MTRAASARIDDDTQGNLTPTASAAARTCAGQLMWPGSLPLAMPIRRLASDAMLRKPRDTPGGMLTVSSGSSTRRRAPSGPQKTSSGSQMSSRPKPKPKVWNPIDSRAQLPAKTIRSAQEMAPPYFFLTGQSRRLALSRLTLSGQLLSGA